MLLFDLKVHYSFYLRYSIKFIKMSMIMVGIIFFIVIILNFRHYTNSLLTRGSLISLKQFFFFLINEKKTSLFIKIRII